ncbi:MAG: hypothetical protein ACYTG2_05555 [Planctomycetota bacterium]|jgi:hypothetical protein
MLLTVALAGLAALSGPALQAGGLDPIFPPERLARVVVPDGSALLDSRLGSSVAELIREQGDADGLDRLAGAVRLATGAEPEAVLRQLVGGELAIGVYDGRGRGARARTRRVLGVSRTTDADDLRRMLDAFVALVGSGKDTSVERRDHAGHTIATLDGKLSLCAADGLFLLATDERLVRDALDLAEGVELSGEPGEGAPLLEFEFDTGLLRSRDARALAPPAGTPARRYANPLANLLFAGVGAGEGRVSGALVERDGQVVLTTQLPASLGEAPAAYAPPDDAPADVPVSAETVAVLFARRDLADWWRHRETLLGEELQPRLAKFDQTLGLLFMGSSPAEDVFAGLTPELALVVDRLDFAAQGPVPDVRMPGACLVARLRDPPRFRTGMQVAFQTLIGIVNTERSKEGDAPFLLETAEHEGVSMRCARLVSDEHAGGMAAGGGGRGAERALSPTLAIMDDVLFLGTSEEQVRRLLSAWRTGRSLEFRGNTELHIDAAVLTRLVLDNRGPLVAKTMLDDGLDPDAAGRRIDGLLAVLDRLGPLELLLEDRPDGARLALRIDPPADPP